MLKQKRGWKQGIITAELRSMGGSTISKGSEVWYKKIKTIPDEDGFKLTDYEWHYMTPQTYIRTSERIIEGLEHIKEKIK